MNTRPLSLAVKAVGGAEAVVDLTLRPGAYDILRVGGHDAGLTSAMGSSPDASPDYAAANGVAVPLAAIEKALRAALRNNWMTPYGVIAGALDFLNIERFDMDLAGPAEPEPGYCVPCEDVIDEAIDALSFDWPAGNHWLNFPFGGERGHKDLWSNYAIAQAAKNPEIVVAFYGPYYGDAWCGRLDAASRGLNWGNFPRVHHPPPLGLTASSPQQHAHKTWIRAGDAARERLPDRPPGAWDWRAQAWIIPPQGAP